MYRRETVAYLEIPTSSFDMPWRLLAPSPTHKTIRVKRNNQQRYPPYTIPSIRFVELLNRQKSWLVVVEFDVVESNVQETRGSAFWWKVLSRFRGAADPGKEHGNLG